MTMDQGRQTRKSEPQSRKPAIVLLIVALIVFGLMLAFLYGTSQNIEWLIPISGRG